MKQIGLYILIAIIVIITGCTSNKAEFAIKQGAYLYKDFSNEITKGVNAIDINIDSGNLQIYYWDKMEVKYEVKHTARDNKTKEELDKLLTKYFVIAKAKGNIYFFTVNYIDKITKPHDFYTDIKLTIPRRIKNIKINQQHGNIIIEDKLEGDITTKLDCVNTEIKYMKGLLVHKSNTGNLRLNSGKLSNGSCVDIETGNIYIKAECQEQSKHQFQTQVGNIYLAFPASSKILLKSFGTVDNNQFTGLEGNTEIKAIAKIGKISVTGY